MMRRTRFRRILAGLSLFALSWSHPVAAQKCRDHPLIRVKSPQQIILGCGNPLDWATTAPTGVEIWELRTSTDSPGKVPVLLTNHIKVESIGGFYFKLTLEPPPPDTASGYLDRLESNHDYTIVLKDSTTTDYSKMSQFSLSTKPEGKIAPTAALTAEGGERFVVSSDIDFQDPTNGHAKLIEVNPKPIPLPNSTENTGDESAEGKETHGTRPQGTEHIVDAQQTGNDPQQQGLLSLRLPASARLRQAKQVLAVDGLNNVLGDAVEVNNSVTLADTPKGIDDSKYYIKADAVAGKGSKPSLALNGKISGSFLSFRGAYFTPSATADVGNANVKAASNQVKFNANWNFTQSAKWKRSATGSDQSEPIVQALVWTPGVGYETDRDFTKSNLMTQFSVTPYFRGMYQTRQNRTFTEAYRAATSDDERKAVIDRLASPEDIDLKKFGYGMYFRLGIEAGGSLLSQTVQNKVKESVTAPQYGIFRFVPAAHGFLEYDRLTLTLDSTFRLIANEEVIAIKDPGNDALSLRSIRGARACNEVGIAYGLDQSKHINLSLTYKNGYQPPVYSNTNGIQGGVLLKY